MITDDKGDEWLTPREAAEHLNLSIGRVYHLKNKLTHKKGNTSRSRVFFLKRTLFNDYINIS